MTRRIFIVAGEISGDMHAAKLVRETRALDAGIEFWGIGGPRMREAGAHTLHDISEMAVLGLWEVLKRIRFFKRIFKEVLAELRTRRPDVLVLVDYPGFNLRLAREAKRMGIRVVYYICPQVWAWHRSRIPAMAKLVDHLFVIFPFEVEVFSGTPLKVSFVGHPLVAEADHARALPLQALPWHGAARIALLPGSRRQEIERILPPMLQAAATLRHGRPDASFIAAAADDAAARQIAEIHRGAQVPLEIVTGQTREILRQARAAMVASGTATIEAALLQCPMIVVYKTNWITYAIGRRLIRVPWLGMVNIAAGARICPEFIQSAAQPESMASAMLELLDETPARHAMVAGLAAVRKALSGAGHPANAAELLLQELAAVPAM